MKFFIQKFLMGRIGRLYVKADAAGSMTAARGLMLTGWNCTMAALRVKKLSTLAARRNLQLD